MVYGFARQAHGVASIHSWPGKGTAVQLHLPEADGPAAPDARQPAPCPEGEGERILVAEGDDAVRAFVVRALDALGYSVDAAASATEAGDLLAGNGDYQVLLTDLAVLGALEGRAARRGDLQLQPGLRILLSTGHGDCRESLHARSLVLSLLHKPYGRSELAAALRRVLARPA